MSELKKTLIKRLRLIHGEPKSELCFSGEYQLIVSVMLSAQSTDKKVNEVSPVFFAKYPDFKGLARAKLASVESIIRPINYFKTKARNLREMAKLVQEKHGGQLPRDYQALISLPGVGNKTANVVLGELGAARTLPVDTHVFRVSRRLGLSSGKDVLEVERDLKSQFLPNSWRALHHLLILHGRRVCRARRPCCQECVLEKDCPSSSLREKTNARG